MATSLLRRVLVLLSAAGAAPYRLAPISLRTQLRAPLVVCAARKSDTAGQGFGRAPEPRSRKPPARPAAASGLPAAAVDESREASVLRGRAALERLREETGSASAATGRKLELTPEELEPMSPEEGVMPEVVSNRMLRRVVPFAGLPVFGSVLLFGGFWVANTQLGYDLPPSIVAYSTQALLLLSFAGITYGVMSTSWDEEDEGSVLGLSEAVKNTKMALGDDKQRQEQAFAEFREDDAAADGVIMSKRALDKLKRRDGQ